MQKLADQALKLKDEVDILRDAADKAAKYEATIDSLKKKLEDLGDLRRQVKLLEEKNTDYMQRNVELEEDVKKTGSWKPQVETYKKQIAELRAKVDAETKKSDRCVVNFSFWYTSFPNSAGNVPVHLRPNEATAYCRLEFDNKKLLEKAEALSVERDRLQAEREELRARNHEMEDEINLAGATKGVPGTIEDGEPESGQFSTHACIIRERRLCRNLKPCIYAGTLLEMIPPSVKERLVRLQHENRQLRSQVKGLGGGGGAEADLMQTMVDDLREREKSLEAENRYYVY